MVITMSMTYSQVQTLRSRFLTHAAESAQYASWSNDFARTNVAEFIAMERKLCRFDPHALTLDQLKELGFGHWDDDLLLIPLWLHPFLEAGIVLKDIGGGYVTVTYDENGKCSIDNDHRFGMLAYGISAKNARGHATPSTVDQHEAVLSPNSGSAD
jgi:hypothetical protein